MGTCVSKCPCFPCHHPCDKPISTAGISLASPAVHPHPMPGEAGAASASPTTSSGSLSLVASTSLCASSSSSSLFSSSASASASASASSSSSHLRRPRELVVLPNATTSSRRSMSSQEWDVVVLDPKSKSSDSDRRKPIINGSGSGKHMLATPAPKRARSASPLSARPTLGYYGYDKQQHKKKRQNAGRSTTATQREIVAPEQARDNKAEVSQCRLRRRGRRVEAKTSSSAHANCTAAGPARVTAEDDLTNPIISMDCFIFL